MLAHYDQAFLSEALEKCAKAAPNKLIVWLPGMKGPMTAAALWKKIGRGEKEELQFLAEGLRAGRLKSCELRIEMILKMKNCDTISQCQIS